jgi:hypothetical protein
MKYNRDLLVAMIFQVLITSALIEGTKLSEAVWCIWRDDSDDIEDEDDIDDVWCIWRKIILAPRLK